MREGNEEIQFLELQQVMQVTKTIIWQLFCGDYKSINIFLCDFVALGHLWQ